MDTTYSTIKRLQRINANEYIFGFSVPIKDSIYTIYHEAKISSEAVHKLHMATNAFFDISDPLNLIDKIDIVVRRDSFCYVRFEVAGSFSETPSQTDIRSVLRLYDLVQKQDCTYSVILKSSVNNELLDFVISESTYYTLDKLIGADTLIVHSAEFQIVESENCDNLKVAYSIGIQLKDTHLKAYYTKATTE